MKKSTLSINFVDFSSDFDATNNLFYNLLIPHYNIVLSDHPDILFFSNFGFKHLLFSCKKIFYSGENNSANYNHCHYSFTFQPTDEKNYYLPHFVEYPYFFDMLERKSNPTLDALAKTKKQSFCNFIASNDRAKERITFVKQLSKHKHVDCMGSVLFNMTQREKSSKTEPSKQFENWRIEKLYEIKTYRFTIAFENEQANHYITEKIFQPLCIKSIPIYWGTEDVTNFFNPNCFINVNNFKTYEDAIQYILKVDNDPYLYQQFFKEHPILDNQHTQALHKTAIIKRLNYYISQPIHAVSFANQLKNYILFAFYHYSYLIKKTLHKFRKWITP